MRSFLYYLTILILLFGCLPDEINWDLPRENPLDGQANGPGGSQVPNKKAPVVITGSVTNISESGSTISGDLSSLGSSSILSFGHCWSLNEVPDLNDSFTNLGSTNNIGIYSSVLSGLSPNKTYYVRAYATNSFGTSYGDQVAFKTKEALCGYINCESLNGFITGVEQISPSSTAAWSVGTGYVGKGLTLAQNSYGGFVEFTIENNSATKMTFWTKSMDPGYQNRFPIVTVDGNESQTKIIDGSTAYTYWMKLETQNLLPGRHTIKINFTRISRFYIYYIDEIVFLCL